MEDLATMLDPTGRSGSALRPRTTCIRKAFSGQKTELARLRAALEQIILRPTSRSSSALRVVLRESDHAITLLAFVQRTDRQIGSNADAQRLNDELVSPARGSRVGEGRIRSRLADMLTTFQALYIEPDHA